MRKYKTWASLNAEGKAVWGEVFPNGEVSVLSIIAQSATLEGVETTGKVFLVDWNELTGKQKDAILEKLSRRSVVATDIILKDVMRIGLPLREKFTDSCGITRLGLFI